MIRKSLKKMNWDNCFDDKELGALKYAKKLTFCQHLLTEKDIESLKKHGWEDGEILEINQVVSYFNYANRTVTGWCDYFRRHFGIISERLR